jgi:hypothetical protein
MNRTRDIKALQESLEAMMAWNLAALTGLLVGGLVMAFSGWWGLAFVFVAYVVMATWEWFASRP